MENIDRMKNTFIALLLIVVGVSPAFAQDIIKKINGEEIKAKVLEVSKKEVKYTLYEEPDGVTYVVDKCDVLMIRYKSGRNEIFDQELIDNLYSSSREPIEGLMPNMKYKELKTIYNYRGYTRTLGDKYSPAWTGVASAFVPGLGECINGEWGRGLGKFFGNVALLVTASVCEQRSDIDPSPAWQIELGVSVACYAASLGIEIWSIVDAIRIAKVKNMYEQDLRKLYSFDIDLYPSLYYIDTAQGIQPAAGFTLALKF